MTQTLEEIIDREFWNSVPETQEECCRLAASISVSILGIPRDFEAAARGLASGLFGDAYEADDGRRRLVWVAMCENALRAEARKFH